jgi:MoaA/NifB/PqqE/SkfB family radical SAM enzyme/trans-aconitate methyltransferase
LRQLAAEFQDLGAVMVTLTGGEPLLRGDLEEIVGLFDDRSCLILGTTGAGLTPHRAQALREKGLFAAGMSLDSTSEAEHDRLRGVEGAFQAALNGIRTAANAGLYPYVVAVATHDFLQPDHFWSFMQFAGENGALEVHLLEPSATGRLAGQHEALLTGAERRRIVELQQEVARDESLPILSSYTYLESADAFGCGAGLSHLYIDGSGEVCPCQLVPLSFGNVREKPLLQILEKMGRHFCKPRAACAGKTMAKHIPAGPLPTRPEISATLCAEHLPSQHRVSRFFHVRSESQAQVGPQELQKAYDRVRGDYDEFWLKEAAKPIEDLVTKLPLEDCQRVFEAGCGTGYATALLSKRLPLSGEILAVDLSEGMLREARKRIRTQGLQNVRFLAGDALQLLSSEEGVNLIFSSWVLGYIPLGLFFEVASRTLTCGGLLALVVHRENSPHEPLEIFGEIVGRDPSILQRRVAFDFPRGPDHLRSELDRAGLEIVDLWADAVTFPYDAAEDVLEHLLKSGAGTAFYDALDPKRRTPLVNEFLKILAQRHESERGIDVVHDYIACIARKPGNIDL